MYSYKKPDRKEHCVVFWDTKTDERYTKCALSHGCNVAPQRGNLATSCVAVLGMAMSCTAVAVRWVLLSWGLRYGWAVTVIIARSIVLRVRIIPAKLIILCGRYVRKLLAIRACGENCVLATQVG